MIRILSIFSLFVFGTCGSPVSLTKPYSPPQAAGRQLEQPKNIILMIGDGMGISQISAGLYSNHNKLNLERCPVVGLIKTHSADDLVTDSAAGGTAFATGKKTRNGSVGVGKNGQPHKSILEIAEANGLMSGLVVTCEITHATPACFYAHQKSRNKHQDIAMDFINSEVDIFFGGGKRYFIERWDEKNLLTDLKWKGFKVMDMEKDFTSIKLGDNEKLACFTGMDQPARQLKGRTYLADATEFTIKELDTRSKKGFFMMVEGSQIDWGGHANDTDYIVSELLDFDKTVGKVLNFAAKDKETLVIITADHETGGLGVNKGSEMKMGELKTGYTTGGHTAAMVPVFAYGPGAETFSGIYENTAIFDKMMKAYGFSK
ncbi:MAG: alkaline phosphatase [Bacteroidota bacterium]